MKRLERCAGPMFERAQKVLLVILKQNTGGDPIKLRFAKRAAKV